MGGDGSGNRSGKPRAPGAGRKPQREAPKKIEIAQDRPLRIGFVDNDGGYSPIAAGPAIIKRTESGTRQIVVKTSDGEIRISL
ncbi:MAG TPA: hypothetical protein VFZ66_29805 [Herpetosiphonaceae bacterium]